MQRTLRATFRRLPGSARGASSLVYVGGYTEKMYYSPTAFHPGGGGGVYGMSLDHDTGALTPLAGGGGDGGGAAAAVYDAGLNPTFLTTNPAATVLLATNECGDDEEVCSTGSGAYATTDCNHEFSNAFAAENLNG